MHGPAKLHRKPVTRIPRKGKHGRDAHRVQPAVQRDVNAPATSNRTSCAAWATVMHPGSTRAGLASISTKHARSCDLRRLRRNILTSCDCRFGGQNVMASRVRARFHDTAMRRLVACVKWPRVPHAVVRTWVASSRELAPSESIERQCHPIAGCGTRSQLTSHVHALRC